VLPPATGSLAVAEPRRVVGGRYGVTVKPVGDCSQSSARSGFGENASHHGGLLFVEHWNLRGIRIDRANLYGVEAEATPAAPLARVGPRVERLRGPVADRVDVTLSLQPVDDAEHLRLRIRRANARCAVDDGDSKALQPAPESQPIL
jgi:hypothetical protein